MFIPLLGYVESIVDVFHTKHLLIYMHILIPVFIHMHMEPHNANILCHIFCNFEIMVSLSAAVLYVFSSLGLPTSGID